MMRARLLASLLAALPLAAACASPCMDVQRILCTCIGQTQAQQSSCEDDRASQEKLDPPDEAELAACSEIADTCDALIAASGCDALQTPEGKRACGFSFD